MGGVQSLFSDPVQDAALRHLASRMGPHPLDRVAQAAVLYRIMPYLDDRGEDGVALPAIDADDVGTLQPLTDLLDTLACDTVEPLTTPTAAAAPHVRRLQVELTTPRGPYTLLLKPTSSIATGRWLPRSWHFACALTLHDIQAAYLMLVGVVPTDTIMARVPWGAVPGFLDTAQQLQTSTAGSDPATIHLPPNVVALALTHALLQGATVNLE